MKKQIILLSLILLSVPTFAQSIGFRDDNSEYLAIGTDYMITRAFSSYDTGVALAIYTDKHAGVKTYYLGLYFETYGKTFCQKHSRAVIKTFSGSIITISEILDTYKVINFREQVGDYQSTTYSLKPQYSISEEDIKILMAEGVQLLRIETLQGLKDFTYKSDVLGGYLTKEYNLILGKQDFGSDF